MDYSIKINEFEGPLDLLLHLIKESNINIVDIEINEITKQYLDYINKMEELNINVAASYLVMAAELMEIKSKSLLPTTENDENDEEDETISKENLINRLLEYEKYKNMVNTFKDMESNRSNIYVKAPERISNYVDSVITNNGDTNIDDLVDAFKKFLERVDREKPITTKITNKEYSVKDRKKGIRNILKEKKHVLFTELFEERTTGYIIVTFLSILEMVKDHEVIIKQDINFKDITIEEVTK
jgi:segregation and condensation protein A